MELGEQTNILLAEDEMALHDTLRLNLEMEGYDVTSAMDGAQAIHQLQQAYFDLVVLDIMLPRVDGFSVLEYMRVQQMDSPVLILSARNAATDRIAGLKKGADDYLTKPFELEELLLRVANLVHKGKALRKTNTETDTYSFGGHTIHFRSLEAALKNGTLLSLSKKEIMLLQLLVSHPNEVITRERILQTVWGYQVYPTTRTIDNFILNFRKHFEEDSRQPRFFHSVRGMGYKFTP